MNGKWVSVILIVLGAASQAATYKIDGDVVGETTHYRVQPDDTLYGIARHFDLGIVEVIAANPTADVWEPVKGEELVLPTAHVLPAVEHKGIVINLSELRLFYFSDHNTVMTFPIGIGMEGWQTPVGKTEVTMKRKNPVWIPPDSLRQENPNLPATVLPGPDNPLGEYALNLGWKSFLIHGTNRPQGIGRRSSHGCIRLYPEDIASLFEVVNVGTPITVIDQPVKMGWLHNDFYLEVTPTQQQLDDIAAYEMPQPSSLHGIHKAVQEAAGRKGIEIDWYAVDNALLEHNAVPVNVSMHK